MSQYLNLKRIEFIVTYRCNSHCKHCHVEAAKRVSRPRALTPELAERAVRDDGEVADFLTGMFRGKR